MFLIFLFLFSVNAFSKQFKIEIKKDNIKLKEPPIVCKYSFRNNAVEFDAVYSLVHNKYTSFKYIFYINGMPHYLYQGDGTSLIMNGHKYYIGKNEHSSDLYGYDNNAENVYQDMYQLCYKPAN